METEVVFFPASLTEDRDGHGFFATLFASSLADEGRPTIVKHYISAAERRFKIGNFFQRLVDGQRALHPVPESHQRHPDCWSWSGVRHRRTFRTAFFVTSTARLGSPLQPRPLHLDPSGSGTRDRQPRRTTSRLSRYHRVAVYHGAPIDFDVKIAGNGSRT
jgi:hypothetical protein